MSLTNAYEQDLVINTGGIFDIGFSINGNNSPQVDALYMADGPWGLDYLATETTISNFAIQNSTNTVNTDEYSIERNIILTGEVKGTANVFRNILPGELTFDASDYSTVSFLLQNTLPVEVVLVTENTTDWNNRLRFQIPANATASDVTIAFSDFTNALGQTLGNEEIKGFVFSTIGNYSTFQPFSIEVSNLRLGNNTALNNQNFDTVLTNKMYNYPNPFTSETTLLLSDEATSANVQLIDITGRIVQDKSYEVNSFKQINFINENAPKGIYLMSVTTDTNHKYQQKVIIK